MEQKTREKSFKQMLWISMISMTMMFAGLTSAYVVSKGREDWVSFDLPGSFYISTILIVLSSISFVLAKSALMSASQSKTTLLLAVTLLLGLGFVFFQFSGFNELIDAGLYTTGPQSNVASSFLYVITATHLLHIFVGILVLAWVLFRNARGKYTPESHLGLSLSAIFWHFVDALWIYLFIFFYFIR
ncbi:cytochrome c oxidase subunit 3 [Lutimonas zeaxanthinifaciens]|uniref:cytochrome c oxidase subunit 3 n=1 Tax=Lutimonas zeaxanthinifaciens TaxID=3060215 RepID=UPI00265CF048|nr:cytochrome c oxidase subunit 3 [Lutimonas sp. YSD2104]WKK66358.1 cytochrome c oxidase subunit 3 [Lutimonas sp. YSD2104]